MRILQLACIALLALFASTLQPTQAMNPLLTAIMEARKSGRPLTAQERLQQEQALYQHLKSLSQEQVAAIQRKLPPALMQRMVERIKVLKKQEKTSTLGVGGGGGGGGTNTVTSGASSVRQSSSGSNSLGGKGSSSRTAMMARMAAMARRIMASRRRRVNPIRGYRSFTSKARGALRAGCSYPIATESVMETFVAGSGGCRMSAAVCYMKGQSCVDIGMSMMCCPPGYSSGTLRMFDQMKQMQSLINSMS